MADWSVKFDMADVEKLLARVESGLLDRRRLHELFVIHVQGHVFRNWPKGPPLSSLTVATRRKGSSAVLQDTGRLRLSITGQSPTTGISKADGTLNAAKDQEAVVGTRLPYARIHQTGGVIRAIRTKNLAIPMTARARAVGSPLNFGKDKLQFVPSKKSGVTGLLVERSRVR